MFFTRAFRAHCRADVDIASADSKVPCVDQHIRYLPARIIVDPRHRRTGDPHPLSAFLLGHLHMIQKTDHLIFIVCKVDISGRLASLRREASGTGQGADTSLFLRSWHMSPPFPSGVQGKSIPGYTIPISVYSIMNICQ